MKLIMRRLCAAALFIFSLGCLAQTPSPAADDVKNNLATNLTADPKVFGVLELGAPFSLPECHKTKYGKATFIYDLVTKEWCYQIDDDLNASHVKIYFPLNDAPQNVNGLFLMGRVLKGRLEGISFNTTGSDSQVMVFTALSNKYGKPENVQNTEVQNGFGAQFPKIIAHWNFLNLSVDFYGIESRIDNGLVVIYTPEAKADFNKKAASGTGRPL